jgi:hypothetical protein
VEQRSTGERAGTDTGTRSGTPEAEEREEARRKQIPNQVGSTQDETRNGTGERSTCSTTPRAEEQGPSGAPGLTGLMGEGEDLGLGGESRCFQNRITARTGTPKPNEHTQKTPAQGFRLRQTRHSAEHRTEQTQQANQRGGGGPAKGGSIPRNRPPKSPQGPCGILTFYDQRSLMPERSRGASAAPSRHPTFHSSRFVDSLRAVGEVHQSDEEHRP